MDVAQLVESRVVIPVVVGSSPIVHPTNQNGPLAQLVEQETLNLLVVGSIPTRPTNSKSCSSHFDRLQPCTGWLRRVGRKKRKKPLARANSVAGTRLEEGGERPWLASC